MKNIVDETIAVLNEYYENDYHDEARAPYNDGDLQKAISNNTPKDEFYGNVNLDAFFRGYPAGGCVWEDVINAYDYDNGESLYQWKRIKEFKDITDKPKTVRIYRTVPNTVTDEIIHNGDWITLSKKYAQLHGDLRYTDNYHILTTTTTTENIWWDGAHICEFGFDDKPLNWDEYKE